MGVSVYGSSVLERERETDRCRERESPVDVMRVRQVTEKNRERESL